MSAPEHREIAPENTNPILQHIKRRFRAKRPKGSIRDRTARRGCGDNERHHRRGAKTGASNRLAICQIGL
eukprot:4088886-Lingulodinium_polyedra.AAC.1